MIFLPCILDLYLNNSCTVTKVVFICCLFLDQSINSLVYKMLQNDENCSQKILYLNQLQETHLETLRQKFKYNTD